jgi:tetratricopeptide (TPR) repeat protein
LRPTDALASYHLALAKEKQGQLAEAAAHYTQAVENKVKFYQALLSLASIRATVPDDRLRDGSEAVRWAEEAVQLKRSAWALDVLAAAYAETGRWPEALRTAPAALQLARSTGARKRAEAIQQRLQRYARKEPFRRTQPLDP